MYENAGFVVGMVRTRNGSSESGAEVALGTVISSAIKLQTVSPSGHVIYTVKTENNGRYVLPFLWNAADLGDAGNNVGVFVSAFIDAGDVKASGIVAQGRTTVTGMILPDLMGSMENSFGNLTDAKGLASFAKTLIQAYRKLRIGPLHLPESKSMSIEQYGIVAYADITLNQ